MFRILKYSVSILILIILTGLISSKTEEYKFNLLVYKNLDGKIRKIKSSVDWNKRRSQILDSLQLVMGKLPVASKKVPTDMKIIEEVNIDGVRRIKITFSTEKNDRVPAYLLIPDKILIPAPGILCLHQTVTAGKDEPAGLWGSPNLHYALELAKRGYVTLAPDYPDFGEYRFDPYSNGYLSATMKGIWNNMAAIDLLQSLAEVDRENIGCIGHSLGGHNTLFLAVFDTRIKVIVTSCGFTSFYKYYNGDLTGWSHKGYMPIIASIYNKDPEKMPFDFSEIIGALAPRPVFINAPMGDSNFDVSGVFDCVKAAKPIYELFNSSDRLVMMNPDAPHDFPPSVRRAAYQFFDDYLKLNNR